LISRVPSIAMISSYSAPVQAAHPEHQTVYKKKSKYSLLSKMISDSNNYFRDDTSGQINHHKDCINDSKSSFKVCIALFDSL
jgi:hypothetical protein